MVGFTFLYGPEQSLRVGGGITPNRLLAGDSQAMVVGKSFHSDRIRSMSWPKMNKSRILDQRTPSKNHRAYSMGRGTRSPQSRVLEFEGLKFDTRTHAFIARTAEPRHPLTLSHYWCKYFVRVDAMHCKDLKGLTAIAAGSFIMHLVTHCNALGDCQQTRLDTLNQRMRRWQIDNGTTHLMPALRLSDLKDNGWHILAGPLVKAANIVQWCRF